MRHLTRREFAKRSLGLAGVGTLSFPLFGGSGLSLPAERRKGAPRRRRIIYNDDGDTRDRPTPPTSVAEFLSRRFDWTKDTQVDSYFWCIGDGQDPPYGLPVSPAVGDGARATLDAARKGGQEAVISLRMNDVHDSYTKTLPLYAPFKPQHRHMFVDPTGGVGKFQPTDRRYWFWSALDFSFPEVRAHKLACIQRICQKYAPDGLEMDFCRAPVCFKFGEESKGISIMTQFVAEVRRALDAISAKVGHRILLIARLPDTPDKSLRFGLDGPTWLKRRLLDVLIIGGGYAPFMENWKEYRDLARKYGIPAYPCVNCSVLQEIKRVEALRGMATNWWFAGAEGSYLFNPFVPAELKHVPTEVMYGEFKHIGDPATLVGLDKVFCQDYILDNHLLGDLMTADTPLPAQLGTRARSFTLTVGEDLSTVPAGKTRHLKLRLQVVPEESGKSLQVELNGQKLPTIEPEAKGWLEHTVQSPPLIQGNNQVRVGLPAGEATLRRMQLWITYG